VIAGTIAIIGSPRAGKTTLAQRMAADDPSLAVVHADDLIGLGWSGASDVLASIMLTPQGPTVYEGVAVVRALRKALQAQPHTAPVARCVVLERPWLRLTPGQARMRTACATILREIEPALRARGVAMERPQ
jgi:Fe-S cluster assembly ATPase SufC